MKRIAVLGSNGQLGQTLRSLTRESHHLFTFFSRKDIDITQKKSIDDALSNNHFDVCINCAAYTNVEQAESDFENAFLVNATGTKNIAEVCKSNHIELIHISTDYVFDGEKRRPYKTNDKTNPINKYGESKLQGELYIQDILLNYFIIRTSWLYSIFGKNFVKTIISKVKDNASLKITTRERGTPTSCIDLSHFIIYIITNDMPYGIYNFSAKGSTTWYGFAREIAKHYNHQKLENVSPVDDFITLAKRPRYSVLDITETEDLYTDLNNWEFSVKNVVEKLLESEG